ncbi:hypothetical protein HYW84_03325 [Candidatus Peregrinibacteria bacterium]|nr:hypothetical protein [Candidatus Peregrinibacteria bacterium]
MSAKMIDQGEILCPPEPLAPIVYDDSRTQVIEMNIRGVLSGALNMAQGRIEKYGRRATPDERARNETGRRDTRRNERHASAAVDRRKRRKKFGV